MSTNPSFTLLHKHIAKKLHGTYINLSEFEIEELQTAIDDTRFFMSQTMRLIAGLSSKNPSWKDYIDTILHNFIKDDDDIKDYLLDNVLPTCYENFYKKIVKLKLTTEMAEILFSPTSANFLKQ